jgi:hypothetical protein
MISQIQSQIYYLVYLTITWTWGAPDDFEFEPDELFRDTDFDDVAGRDLDELDPDADAEWILLLSDFEGDFSLVGLTDDEDDFEDFEDIVNIFTWRCYNWE